MGIHDLVASGSSVELDVPPIKIPQPSHANFKQVSVPYVPHSHLGDYEQTGYEGLEEESEPVGEVEEGLAKQGTVDKHGFSYDLWKIHQGLMMSADWVKDLISVVRGWMSDLPAVLLILRLVTGAASYR